MQTDENPVEQTSDTSLGDVVAAEQLPAKLQQLWKKSESAVDLKNYDYTISLMQAVLEKEPGFLDGRRLLRKAEILKKEEAGKKFGVSKGALNAAKVQPLVKKDPLAAIVALEREVLVEEPYNAQGNQLLFNAAIAADLPTTAGFALEVLVRGNPDNIKYMHQLGDFYLDRQMFSDASRVFDRIVKENPSDLQAIQKSKNASAQASMQKSNYGGSFRDNLRHADQAAQLESKERAGMTRDQIELRISQLQEAYAQDQNDLATVKELAAMYEQKEDYDTAVQYYDWAYQLSNSDVSLQRKLIEIRELGSKQKIREYESWLTENEGHEEYDRVKADYDQFKRELMQGQIDEYREQVEKNPTDNTLRFKYGEVLYQAGELKDAIPQLQRAQGAPSLRIKAMLILGKCYDGRNMIDLAINQLSKACEELANMDDTKKEVLYTLGLVHAKNGNKVESLECMKQIYEVDYDYRDVAERVESSYS